MGWNYLPLCPESDQRKPCDLELATLYKDYEKRVARITKFVLIQELLPESLPNLAQ